MGKTLKKWTVCGFTYEAGRRRERFRRHVIAHTREGAKAYVACFYQDEARGLTLTAWLSGR